MLTDRLVASTNASLKSNATIWSRIKKKVDWDAGAPPPNMNVPMGIGGPVVGGGIPGGGQVMRQRFLTLCYGDMETIKNLPSSYAVSPPHPFATRDHHLNFLLPFQEAEAIAREWVKPPPDASFHLRVPVEYASLQASVGCGLIMMHGPWRLLNLHSDSFKVLGYGYVYQTLSHTTSLTPVRYLLTKHTKLPSQASTACGWKLLLMRLLRQSASAVIAYSNTD